MIGRIAIIIPTLKKGGAEKQASLLARALTEEGYSVDFIITDPMSGLEEENVKLIGGNAKIHLLKAGSLSLICPIVKILKENHTDIVFCYLTKPDLIGVIAARIAGVKYIYQGLRNAKLPPVKFIMELVGNQIATGAVTNNYSGAEIFRRRGIRNQIVIPNCYLSPHDYTERKFSDAITVITVGRFVEQKDYPTAISAMLKAMEREPRLRFKIIGHGPLEKMIRTRVGQSELSNNVDILINPPGIMNHLLNADIYLSTSLFEGTSNSIMEAMDASLPIIATNVGDNNRLVIDGENGFITETGDIDNIAAKIIELAMNPVLRLAMGKRSNEILKTNYSFESFKNNYLRLLNS